MKAGTAYEIVTRGVFEALLNQDSVKTIEVHHDVVLPGRSTEHQIDVYWQFEVGGFRYETVVQVKDWEKPVNKGELLKFKAVLDDLPGRPTGILVTRSGLQAGAEMYAKAQEIGVYSIEEEKRPPIQIPVGSRVEVRAVSPLSPTENVIADMEMTVYTPRFSNVVINIDTVWARDQGISLDSDAVRNLPDHVTRTPAGFDLHDEEMKVATNLIKVFAAHVGDMHKNKVFEDSRQVALETATYLAIGIEGVPRLKIASVKADIRLERGETYRTPFRLVGLATFIVKNVLDGTQRMVDVQGNES